MDDILKLDDIVRAALEEDIGSGDLTTTAVVEPETMGVAELLARENLVLAGMGVFQRVFELLSDQVDMDVFFGDGQGVPADQKVCVLEGPADVILLGERTALNFIQRMSGIATATREFVNRVNNRNIRVVDTRKTAPGLRMLDKYAVKAGGGHNHRFGLYDGILIKDNHIVAAGSIAGAVALAREKSPHTIKVEVEVEDLEGAEEAVEAGADIVLLDNMSPDLMQDAVKRINGRALVEASGGITLDNIHEIARTGVDIISVGALTHSPRAADFSLGLKPL